MVQKEAIRGLDTLVKVAIDGLPFMFDADTRMFCERVSRQGTSLKREGQSTWETLNALLGLNEAFQYELAVPLDLSSVTRHHIDQANSTDQLSRLGAVLWLAARSHPDALPALYDRVELPKALDRFNEDRNGVTHDLSFFLIGLSEIRLSDAEEPVYLNELAYMVKQLLFVNYGGFGIFSSSRKGGINSLKKGKHGSFTDQIFAMYSFTRYARAFNDEHALSIALECAHNLVKQQGELGQWWSLYDVNGGSVARLYPVYSMHQDALAPMGLLALSEITGEDFSDQVNFGIQWLYANNEIDLHLVSSSLNVIWEGVQDSKRKLYSIDPISSLNLLPLRDKKRTLTASFECRPSHLGWLLYALSGFAEP